MDGGTLLSPGKMVAPSSVAGYLTAGYYKQRRKIDNKSWALSLRLHTSAFVMVPWVILVLFTAALTVADGYLFVPVSDGVHPDGELVPASLPTQVHTVLGGTLSFLMVFRTNTAYGKWWEARCSWSGVGGTSRTLAARLCCILKPDAVAPALAELMAVAVTLKNHLRDAPTEEAELGPLLSVEKIRAFERSANPPITALRQLSKTIYKGLNKEDTLAVHGFQQVQVNIDTLASSIGACERIKSTPMPFGYVAALRGFLLMFLFTLPFTMVGTFHTWAIGGQALIAFIFLDLEQMAMEIEQPFGDDEDDLPLENYCLDIEKILLDVLNEGPEAPQ